VPQNLGRGCGFKPGANEIAIEIFDRKRRRENLFPGYSVTLRRNCAISYGLEPSIPSLEYVWRVGLLTAAMSAWNPTDA